MTGAGRRAHDRSRSGLAGGGKGETRRGSGAGGGAVLGRGGGPRTAGYLQRRPKAQFRMRIASAPLTMKPEPGPLRVTPMKEWPFRLAWKSRQYPAAGADPALRPIAARE